MISDILFDLSENLTGHEGLPAVYSITLPDALKELDEEMLDEEYTKTYGKVDQEAIARIREDLKNTLEDRNSSVKRFGERALELANFLAQ